MPGAALHKPGPEPPSGAPDLPHRRSAAGAPGAAEVPGPLARLVGGDLDAVRWRWVSPGSWIRRVPVAGEGRLHLFRCASRVALPEHGHEGSELTMVLRGTLVDSTGRYARGDVCDLDDSIQHIPTAGAEGCVCVVAQDRPVRFRGLMARLARPWHGM
jgi:putative transcriptional regulator